jgi:hypothetical protein
MISLVGGGDLTALETGQRGRLGTPTLVLEQASKVRWWIGFVGHCLPPTREKSPIATTFVFKDGKWRLTKGGWQNETLPTSTVAMIRQCRCRRHRTWRPSAYVFDSINLASVGQTALIGMFAIWTGQVRRISSSWSRSSMVLLFMLLTASLIPDDAYARGGRGGGGGFRGGGGGFHGGGVRAGGFRGDAVAGRGYRGGAVAVRGARGGAVAVRGGRYGYGGYGYRPRYGAAAVGAAAVGAAAAGAYYNRGCGYDAYGNWVCY